MVLLLPPSPGIKMGGVVRVPQWGVFWNKEGSGLKWGWDLKCCSLKSRSWGAVEDQEIPSWRRYENWKFALVSDHLGLTWGSSLSRAGVAQVCGVSLHQRSSTKGIFAFTDTLEGICQCLRTLWLLQLKVLLASRECKTRTWLKNPTTVSQQKILRHNI